MTTIAWDGKMLAADRRFSGGNGSFTTTKIRRVKGCLVAMAGNFSLALELAQWFEDGANPKEFPSANRDIDKGATLVVIQADGLIFKYESSPVPCPFYDKKIAIGSGGDFARAAMHLGVAADVAVEIAALFDNTTGNGVNTLTF